MADWHGYMGIENLGLTGPQRATLIDGLGGLGNAQASTRPEWRNHRRVRLDNDAAIFEALFDDATLTIAAVKQWLADIFGIAPALISHAATSPSFSAGRVSSVVVYSRPSGTPRLRFCLFGGAGATREDSRQEALGYLAANVALWAPGVPNA